MKTNRFLNLLAFLILMGNEEILAKSPDYIVEKFTRYTGLDPYEDIAERSNFSWGLNGPNSELLERYQDKWLRPDGGTDVEV